MLSELLLADIWRLSVVAVVFLYEITVFLQQNTTASLLELYFNDSMQTVYAHGGAAAVAMEVDKDRSPMGRLGRCSIYRHRWVSLPCQFLFHLSTNPITHTFSRMMLQKYHSADIPKSL